MYCAAGGSCINVLSHYSNLTNGSYSHSGQCSFKCIQYQIHNVLQLPEELINHILGFSHSSHSGNYTGAWLLFPKLKKCFLSSVSQLPVVLSFRLSLRFSLHFIWPLHSTWGRALCEVLINVTATQTVKGNCVIQTSTMTWQFTFFLSLGMGTDLCWRLLSEFNLSTNGAIDMKCPEKALLP